MFDLLKETFGISATLQGSAENELLWFIVALGLGGLIFMGILLKLAFISMKRADNKRTLHIHKQLEERINAKEDQKI